MAKTKRELEVTHTVHWWIAEGYNWDICWSRHEIDVQYGKRVAKLFLDVWAKPTNLSTTTHNPSNGENSTSLRHNGWNIGKADAILLSHAHYDHWGELVFLPKNWFKKQIFTPDITKNLEEILMFDSLEKQDKLIASTNESLKKKYEQLKLANRNLETQLGMKKTRDVKVKKWSKNWSMSYDDIQSIFEKKWINIIAPLTQEQLKEHAPTYLKREFSWSDVKNVLNKMKSIGYYREFPIISNLINWKFYNAGHINGSASTLLKVFLENSEQKKNKDKHKEKTFNILYTGDIGRFKEPGKAWKPDIPKERIDYLGIEGTYWDKLHPNRMAETEKLYNEINSAKGFVLIPCFTLERFQELKELLWEWIASWKIKMGEGEKIFCDSKLAYNLSKEYLINDEDGKYSYLKENPHMTWVQNENNTHGENSPKEILQINWRVIVLCTWWMWEMGTISEYLSTVTKRSDAKILLTWFQAPWTIGYKLKHNIFDEPIVINNSIITENKAAIKSFSFSSHGDQDDLMHFIKNCNLSDNVKISILHGWEQRKALAKKVENYLLEREKNKKSKKRNRSNPDSQDTRQVIVPEKNWDSITIKPSQD